MGVPVVTLPMDQPASRQSLAFLQALDLAELAAGSAKSYHAIAVALARDPVRLADLRSGLRGRMLKSTLCRPEVFTPALEAAYRAMWWRSAF